MHSRNLAAHWIVPNHSGRESFWKVLFPTSGSSFWNSMEKTFLTIFRHWSVLILLVVTERHSPIIEVFLEVMFESCQLWSVPKKGQGFYGHLFAQIRWKPLHRSILNLNSNKSKIFYNWGSIFDSEISYKLANSGKLETMANFDSLVTLRYEQRISVPWIHFGYRSCS